MVFQHVDAVRHGNHYVVKAGTIRTKCLEHTLILKLIHRHAVHLLEHSNDSIHGATLINKINQFALGKTKRFLNGGGVTLYACKHLIKGRCTDFRHETH